MHWNHPFYTSPIFSREMFTILRGVLLHIYVFSLDYRYLDGSCEMNPTFDLASDTPMNVSHQLRKTLPKAQRTQCIENFDSINCLTKIS